VLSGSSPCPFKKLRRRVLKSFKNIESDDKEKITKFILDHIQFSTNVNLSSANKDE
jgi:hypothetical protein